MSYVISLYPWVHQSQIQQPKYFYDTWRINTTNNFSTQNIIFYTRYVDDILILYDTKRTNPNLINKYINQIHTNI